MRYLWVHAYTTMVRVATRQGKVFFFKVRETSGNSEICQGKFKLCVRAK